MTATRAMFPEKALPVVEVMIPRDSDGVAASRHSILSTRDYATFLAIRKDYSTEDMFAQRSKFNMHSLLILSQSFLLYHPPC